MFFFLEYDYYFKLYVFVFDVLYIIYEYNVMFFDVLIF